jgi:hypothetical protein
VRTHVSLWHRRTLIGEPTTGLAAVLALDPERSSVALKGLRTLEDLQLVTMSTVAGRHAAARTAKAMLPKLRVVA